MLTARVPAAVIARFESLAEQLGVRRSDVVRAACESLELRCPVPDCDFTLPGPGTCPIHVRQLVLP